MSPLSLPRSLLLSTLSTLVLLAASPARADLPSETIYLSRAEISDESLRGVIGIAFISSMTGPDQQLSGEIPHFQPDGEDFEQEGTLPLKDLRAISGWDYDLQSLRKFPVVERRGHYLHVVVDVRTNERAWISDIQEAETGPEVEYLGFDSKQWEYQGIELYHFAPKAQTRLYTAPRADARFHPLSPDYPPRRKGEYAQDVRIIKTKGNFIQIGDTLSLDQPLEPLGWLPISDENGLLLIWPMYAPMC
jgi:hypothetical protein